MKGVLFALLCLLSVAARADYSGTSDVSHRAYPPSCLSYPLEAMVPAPGTTPSNAFTMDVNAINTVTGAYTKENVGLYIARVACEGGRSALTGIMIRQPQNQGRTDVVVVLPWVYITQGSTVRQPARLAAEPNTATSSLFRAPISSAVYFVFENPLSGNLIDFNQPMSVSFENGLIPNGVSVVQLPGYEPSQFPTASLPMPISGYHTGNWFDPAHNGEGAQVEVLEIGAPNTANNRVVTFAWYSYDPTGVPFWLFGAAVYSQGDRTVTVQLSYTFGGGFAGNFGASASSAPWGSVTLQFPNCNSLSLGYQSNAGLPVGVPTGSGARSWARASGISGLACR